MSYQHQPRPFRRAAATLLTVALVAAGLAAGAATAAPAASPSEAGASAKPTSVVSPARPAQSKPEPVASLNEQRRAILYKPDAAPTSTVPTMGPSVAAPPAAAAAARADAAAECQSGPAASICVTFTGFTQANLGPAYVDAKQAYQAAVQVWANLLKSTVPITISVDVASQGSDILASTGANNSFQLTPGGPWYPVALANALAGRDLTPSQPQIVSTMGSYADTPWYYGTDGNVPVGDYDFESVVLHEIGHGLGILSFTNVGLGCAGGTGCFGSGSNSSPSVYDTWLVASLSATSPNVGWLTVGPQGQAGAFGNNTDALRGALTGWNTVGDGRCSTIQPSRVFWAGPQGTAANGNSWPKIYSPNPWSPGSNISHLDQGTYPWPGPNSVLTPCVPTAKAVHAPGPIILGMLRDIGWTETVVPVITSALASGPTPTPGVGSVSLTWTPATLGIDGVSPVSGYQLQAGRYDNTGTITTITVGSSATSYTIPGLATGVAYWVSVTPLSAAQGPGAAFAAVPQDLGSYPSVAALAAAVVPNLLGTPNAVLSNAISAQLSYPNVISTAQELANLNAFVLDGSLGPLTRLYQAYFTRLPDAGGVQYWLQMLRGGTTLATVSNYFAGSPEFVGTYGNLSNAQFLARVYQNVLGRQPDQGGYTYWMNQLSAGMPRGSLMLNFSESAEFKSVKAAAVLAVEGYWVMRQQVPTPDQVTSTSGMSAVRVFQGLLDNTIS